MPGAKRVPKYVPQREIFWLMGRIHVGTPDSEVEANIRRRLEGNKPTEKQVAACIDYALACHRENQELYRKVTSGRF